MQRTDREAGQPSIMTIAAFADTIVPGEKRWPGDVVVAGAATGGGAVAAGAVELIATPAAGLANAFEDYAEGLGRHAQAYAEEHRLPLDTSLPPFVALPFGHRTTVVEMLTAPGHPERDLWVLLTLFSFMAFDTAAHMHTADAIAERHPGLATMQFAAPDADGLWRFPDYSYGRQLASLHPETSPSGSPA